LKIKNIKICVNTPGLRLIFKVLPIRLKYFINIIIFKKSKFLKQHYFFYLYLFRQKSALFNILLPCSFTLGWATFFIGAAISRAKVTCTSRRRP